MGCFNGEKLCAVWADPADDIDAQMAAILSHPGFLWRISFCLLIRIQFASGSLFRIPPSVLLSVVLCHLVSRIKLHEIQCRFREVFTRAEYRRQMTEVRLVVFAL